MNGMISGETPAQRVNRMKERAAIVSVGASVVLTLGKAFAAYVSGSLALYSEAAHGLIDIAATLTTWFAIRAADKPADDEHHYGHGKIESLAALAECALLLALAGAVAWEAGSRLWSGVHPPVEVTPVVIGVLVVAILIDGTRWRALHLIAKATHSEALAADALHFASDLVSSALTLIGLLMVLAGYAHGDTAAALGVSLFIFSAAIKLALRTIGTLVDTAPKGMRERLEETALAVPGVAEVEWLRLRPGGGRMQGELGVKVSRTLGLEQVSAIKQDLAGALAVAAPNADITITANPMQTEDENALERVMMIAARLRVPVHHFTLQKVGERNCISLDMEVDARMPLAAAHQLATHLEAAIRADFGPLTEVETHVEPLAMTAGDGEDAAPAIVAEVAAMLAGACGDGAVRDIHNVRVRTTEAGLIVNFHCRADGAMDVAAVHVAVDEIERALRQSRSDIARVVGHAEPLQPGGATAAGAAPA
ncbi:MAG: cation-efflux pump [Bosea sp.]|nr:cation-efflux pump [Bosea sp. (in: a-proteobacteria)]